MGTTTMVLCASHAPGMDRDVTGVEGRAFREGVAAARDRVAAFDPELVVLFAGDHRRAFTSVVPSFAVAVAADLMAEGMQARARLPVPADTAYALARHLLADGFDIAVCRDIELDHAFGQPLGHYLGSVGKVPVLPLPINCASPPLPSAARVVAYGESVGRFLTTLDRRVLVLGTGGLGHHPGSLTNDRHDLTEAERRELIEQGRAAAVLRMNPAWDQRFLRAMEAWDVDQLIEMTEDCVNEAGVGANEVRNWLAAGAAGGGGAVQALAYEPVPAWITGMGIVASPISRSESGSAA
ncbi:MAG: mhpB [Frankiales bacterium]|nr:mhpB [Frankiales bacterium]